MYMVDVCDATHIVSIVVFMATAALHWWLIFYLCTSDHFFSAQIVTVQSRHSQCTHGLQLLYFLNFNEFDKKN